MNVTELCTGGVTLHPCCIGLLGDCVVTTEQNCSFHDGVWHPGQILCSQVGTDCFKHICEFSWVGKTIGDKVPNQGMRFFSAMFLYDGVITLLIVGVFKLYNCWTIERRIGYIILIQQEFQAFELLFVGGCVCSAFTSPLGLVAFC